jgi:hypothetical protein
MKAHLLTLALAALTMPILAQTPMPVIPPTGHVATPGVSLAYWVYDRPQPTTQPLWLDGSAGRPFEPIPKTIFFKNSPKSACQAHQPLKPTNHPVSIGDFSPKIIGVVGIPNLIN